MGEIKNKLDSISQLEQRLAVKKMMLLEKAMTGNSPADLIRAKQVLEQNDAINSGKKKSFLIDPLEFNHNFGYKDKPFSLSYTTLKRMSKTPIINAILKTRKNQIADFAEPQADKYSTGFIIRKKRKLGEPERDNTPEEWAKIEELQETILNCGVTSGWHTDDFETFIRKVVEDSLIYDQMTFEIVRDRRGKLHEFFATDAATFRLADSYDDDMYEGDERELVNGHYPSYVQIYQGAVKSVFYPWELCFGVRNPSTNLYNQGYGMSELEELVSTVTSMLWADEYNKRFFSQGSAPKGLLRVKGNVNEKQLQAFRQEWLSMITGVQQSWKTPIVDADIDWIDLQKSNRDMEYNSWTEYLIKLSCAIYAIDPNEIGFNISTTPGTKSLFESNNEGKLKHSKDKGLYPLLKFIQRKINKFIISQIDPDYEFCFVGLNGMTIAEELDIEVKKLANFQTVNEIRKKYALEPVEGGDIILNPTYSQQLMMKQQQAQQAGAMGMGGEAGGDGEFDINEFLGAAEDEENPFLSGESEDNPFVKSFLNNMLKR
jgi:hypothetical protein